MTRRGIVFAIGLSLAGSAVGQTADTRPPLTLADLERIALEKNPTLAQAGAEVDAALGRAEQAGLLTQPVIGYFAEEFAFRAGEGRGKQGVFLEQTLPIGGKLRASREIFDREAAEAEAIRETQRMRILNSVRSLYYEALIAERRVRVRERLAELTDEAVRVSGQLYNTGAADRPDVLESEIEAREARLALDDARNRRYHTWLSLAAMIGEPELPLQPLAGDTDAPPPELDRSTAVAELLRDSPQIRRARLQVERAAAVLDRADRARFPDIFLRVEADYDRELSEAQPGRAVGWEGGLSAGISLPLFNRNQGDRAAARANLERAKADVRRLELALTSRVSGVFEAYLTSLHMSEEYAREILPRAEEAHRLYLERFRQMAAAYPQVLIAQRTLFQTSERYLSALQEAHVAAVQIRGLLLVDGLDAPPEPGKMEPGIGASEIPGAVRSGELPVSVKPPGQE